MPSDAPAPERYELSADCTHEEFLAASRIYARDVVEAFGLDVTVSDLSWEVSSRAKRRAGAVYHRGGEPESVRLTWEYFEETGWSAMADTIRHELIHVHLLNRKGDPGHGEEFQRLADRLNTNVHCERFADPKWWVVCEDCPTRIARYRRSKLVERPAEYECRECGGDVLVERNE